MKAPVLIALVAAGAGFAVGWVLKPAPTVVETPAATPASRAQAAPQREAPTPDAGPAPSPHNRTVPPPDSRGGSQIAAAPPAGRDAAKLNRLAEVLGLDAAGKEKLTGDIAAALLLLVPPSPDQAPTPEEARDIYIKAGESLGKSLVENFTPEQAAAFAALCERSRNARIATRVGDELGRISGITDLDPGQREKIAERVRANETAEIGKIPEALAFFSASSPLPLGSRALPEDTLLMIASGNDGTVPGSVFPPTERMRQRLEQQAGYLRDILTPAQYAQFEAYAAEQRAMLERMAAPPR